MKRESEEVECAISPTLFIFAWGLEGNQARLRGMNGQSEFTEPFRQHRHQKPGILSAVATDDEVISETNEEYLPFPARGGLVCLRP